MVFFAGVYELSRGDVDATEVELRQAKGNRQNPAPEVVTIPRPPGPGAKIIRPHITKLQRSYLKSLPNGSCQESKENETDQGG